jgi:GTP-binding protein
MAFSHHVLKPHASTRTSQYTRVPLPMHVFTTTTSLLAQSRRSSSSPKKSSNASNRSGNNNPNNNKNKKGSIPPVINKAYANTGKSFTAASKTSRSSPLQSTAVSSSNKPVTPGSAPPPKKKQQRTTPPWKIVSESERTRQVSLEIQRRERARQGDHASNRSLDDPDNTNTPPLLSKAFLPEVDRRLLSWKRSWVEQAPTQLRLVGSYLKPQFPPYLGIPEIAFVGRSNVGKSSLLNRLATVTSHAPTRARVSSTPGATATVNVYALYDTRSTKQERPVLGLVDLPGLGYAQLSRAVQDAVMATAQDYLQRRRTLMLALLLVDVRRTTPSAYDRTLLAALYDQGVPLLVVATKLDQVAVSDRTRHLEAIREGLGLPQGQPLAVSSTTGEGCRQLFQIVLDACHGGVQERLVKYEGASVLDEDEEDVDAWFADDGSGTDNNFVDDDEELVYSQGYDWVHDSPILYEGDELDDDDDDIYGDMDMRPTSNPSPPPKTESMKDLRKRAKGLMRKGE